MFYSKAHMETVEKVQCKSLQVVYNNFMVTNHDIIASDNKLKIHQRHLQSLTFEIVKSRNKLNPSFYVECIRGENDSVFTKKRDSPPDSKSNTQEFGINPLKVGGSVL